MKRKQQELESLATLVSPICAGCGNSFGPKRRNQRHCDEACKQVAYRKRQQEKRHTQLYLEALRLREQQRLTIVPCTLEQANAFVHRWHRHHGMVPVARLALAVADERGLVRGVAIVGRPCNTILDDDWTLEVRRVCTDGCPNACSALYAACWKATRAIGYSRLITYTLPEEGGASLRAVGWKEVRGCGGKPWNHARRKRNENPLFLLKKTRWEISTKAYHPCSSVIWPKEIRTATQEILISPE